MRNLRAELQYRVDNEPVVWKPCCGDILVGVVCDADEIPASDPSVLLAVREERTGVPVLVVSDSLQLAALLELHKPQPADRIGIKCAGPATTGEQHFIMVVDRANESDVTPPELATQQASNAASSTPQDCDTATPQEREFIENTFAAYGYSNQEHCDKRNAPAFSIQGMISQGVEELDGQERALERLESLIVPPSPAPDAAQETEICPEPASQVDSLSESAAPIEFAPAPKAKKGRLRGLLILLLALLCAATAEFGYFYMDTLLKWINR